MSQSGQKTNYFIEIILLALLAGLWGSSYTLIKLGIATIPPLTFIGGRTLIAGFLLLCVMKLQGIHFPRDATLWRRLMFQACMNSVLPFTLIAWAEQSINADLAVILNAATPIFTFLITWMVTRHETTSLRKSFGVGIGLAGICLIVGLQAFAGLGKELIAQLAVILATFCYAIAAIYGKSFGKLHPLVPATGSLLCGSLILLPASLLIDRPWMLHPSLESLGALTALAVFSTALAFTLFFRLLRTLGSVGATSQAYLRVPFGVGIAICFLGETLSPTAWVGFVCVIIGVLAMTLPSTIREKFIGTFIRRKAAI